MRARVILESLFEKYVWIAFEHFAESANSPVGGVVTGFQLLHPLMSKAAEVPCLHQPGRKLLLSPFFGFAHFLNFVSAKIHTEAA